MHGVARALVAFLIAVLAASISGCWAWRCGKSYHLNAIQESNVGQPMIYVAKFLRHKNSGAVYNGPHEGTRGRELVYSGRSGSTISVTYREYADSFIKPAFSQDLKYDLGTSDTIAFDDWRLRVLEANNQHIRFEVMDDSGVCSTVDAAAFPSEVIGDQVIGKP